MSYAQKSDCKCASSIQTLKEVKEALFTAEMERKDIQDNKLENNGVTPSNDIMSS